MQATADTSLSLWFVRACVCVCVCVCVVKLLTCFVSSAQHEDFHQLSHILRFGGAKKSVSHIDSERSTSPSTCSDPVSAARFPQGADLQEGPRHRCLADLPVSPLEFGITPTNATLLVNNLTTPAVQSRSKIFYSGQFGHCAVLRFSLWTWRA